MSLHPLMVAMVLNGLGVLVCAVVVIVSGDKLMALFGAGLCCFQARYYLLWRARP